MSAASNHNTPEFRPAVLWTIITGAATLVTLILMLAQAPIPEFAPSQYNPGFAQSQTILWFELAHSAEEVQAVLTPADGKADIRGILDRLHIFDFPFLVAYNLFIAAIMGFLWQLHRERGQGFFASSSFLIAGLLLVPVAITGTKRSEIQRKYCGLDPREPSIQIPTAAGARKTPTA